MDFSHFKRAYVEGQIRQKKTDNEIRITSDCDVLCLFSIYLQADDAEHCYIQEY